MASVSIAHMILFIASMLVAASVAGVFTNTVDQLSDAIDDQAVQISQDVRTDIEIISDSGSDAIYDNSTTPGTTTLHVKNTGSERLRNETNAISVFIDGQYETDVETRVLGDSSIWWPGEVIELQIAEDLTSGEDYRIKVVVNGDEEVFEFRA